MIPRGQAVEVDVEAFGRCKGATSVTRKLTHTETDGRDPHHLNKCCEN